MERVAGIGGVFFRATDPVALARWYREVLGVDANASDADVVWWPQAGQPVGHSEAPILVRQASGPIEAVAPNQFRMKFSGVCPVDEAGRVTFMAYSEGDDEYRYTELVGMMPRGFKGLGKGKSQKLTFEPIANVKADSAPIELKASSDAETKVEFYVAHGPAEIVDGKLKLSQIPARATYPIEVKVVAYHFGSGVEPFVQTASPVERTFQIEKP